MTHCECAFVYAETARTLRGRPGCKRCGGTGVVPTPLTADEVAVLERNGWSRTGVDSFGHPDRGENVRPETALAIAMSAERRHRYESE